MFDASLCGWLLLQATLLAAAGAAIAAWAPGLSAGGRARIALETLLLMSAVGMLGAASLTAWSWGDGLRARLPRAAMAPVAAAPDVPIASGSTVDRSTQPNREGGAEGSFSSSREVPDWAWALARVFEPAESRPVAASQETPPRWWLAVVAAIVAMQLLGLVRFVWGRWRVARYRCRAIAVEDSAIQGLQEEVACQLGIRHRVALAELAELSTPAVVGWRRPLILLPSDWRDWNAGEQRAVLAHELAHVQRGDVLTTTMAALALVPHFYHPLAHLLASRLRMQQEIAADALACGPAGGRQPYLKALAGLALRRSDAHVGWSVSAFLPTGRMFMRRIEMLRTLRINPRRGAAIWHAAAGLALLFVAVAVTGLRPSPVVAQQDDPRRGAEDQAAPEEERQEAAARLTNVDPVAFFASAEIAVVLDLDIDQLRASPTLQPLVAEGQSASVDAFEKLVGGPLELVERLTIGFTKPPAATPRGRDWPPVHYAGHVVTYRDVAAAEAARARQVIVGDFAVALEPGEAETPAGDLDRVRVAPRRVLFGNAGQIQTILLTALDPSTDSLADRLMRWNPGKQEGRSPAVRIGFDIAGLRPPLRAALSETPGPTLAALEPLVTEVDALFLELTADPAMKVEGRLDCRSAEAAERVSETLEAVRVLASNALRREFGPASEPTARTMINAHLSAVRALVDSLQFTADGQLVTVKGKADAPQGAMLTAIAVPAIQQVSFAMRLRRSVENLARLGLALHNYHDMHGHLPPAVIEGPEGVPRSWRVELLPFLDATALYERYRKDEPWDSQHNLQVLEEMPSVFRHPEQPPGTTDTAYQTIVGEGMALSGAEARFEDFVVSDTMLVVESRRGVPWTKPEDVAFDPEAILSGGFADDVPTLFGDGSVRLLRSDLDPNLLRRLLTRLGDEPVKREELPEEILLRIRRTLPFTPAR